MPDRTDGRNPATHRLSNQELKIRRPRDLLATDKRSLPRYPLQRSNGLRTRRHDMADIGRGDVWRAAWHFRRKASTGHRISRHNRKQQPRRQQPGSSPRQGLPHRWKYLTGTRIAFEMELPLATPARVAAAQPSAG